MTREELQEIKAQLSQIIDDIAGNPDWQEAASALASDIGTLERNLAKMVIVSPQGLDEAANNYGIDIRLGYPRVMDETDKYIYNAFKAGAEWMAGQGETVDAEVVATSENGWESVRIFKKLHNVGDKVVVQIRRSNTL